MGSKTRKKRFSKTITFHFFVPPHSALAALVIFFPDVVPWRDRSMTEIDWNLAGPKREHQGHMPEVQGSRRLGRAYPVQSSLTRVGL
jgi:hypothetical protein